MKKLFLSLFVIMIFSSISFALSNEGKKILEEVNHEISDFKLCIQMISSSNPDTETSRKFYIGFLTEQYKQKKEKAETMLSDMTNEQFKEYKLVAGFKLHETKRSVLLNINKMLDKKLGKKINTINQMSHNEILEEITIIITDLENIKSKLVEKKVSKSKTVKLLKNIGKTLRTTREKFFRTIGVPIYFLLSPIMFPIQK